MSAIIKISSICCQYLYCTTHTAPGLMLDKHSPCGFVLIDIQGKSWSGSRAVSLSVDLSVIVQNVVGFMLIINECLRAYPKWSGPLSMHRSEILFGWQYYACGNGTSFPPQSWNLSCLMENFVVPLQRGLKNCHSEHNRLINLQFHQARPCRWGVTTHWLWELVNVMKMYDSYSVIYLFPLPSIMY